METRRGSRRDGRGGCARRKERLTCGVAVSASEQRASACAGERARNGLTREWAGDGVGLRRKKRNGPRWKFMGRRERETAGWAQAGLVLGLPLLFLVFSLLFLFQTSHSLFEFKFEFEFNSSTQQIKQCSSMNAQTC